MQRNADAGSLYHQNDTMKKIALIAMLACLAWGNLAAQSQEQPLFKQLENISKQLEQWVKSFPLKQDSLNTIQWDTLIQRQFEPQMRHFENLNLDDLGIKLQGQDSILTMDLAKMQRQMMQMAEQMQKQFEGMEKNGEGLFPFFRFFEENENPPAPAKPSEPNKPGEPLKPESKPKLKGKTYKL
jgi:hypothetical protein